MQLVYLLFLMTVGQGGELFAAYSPYKDKTGREGALESVAAIFEANDITADYKGYVSTEHGSTPFEHTPPDNAPRFMTLNALDNDGSRVTFQLLFLITVGQGGELFAAYSTYKDKTECAGALKLVAAIFKANDITTDYKGCVSTAHGFTAFEHTPPDDAPRFMTLNVLDNGRLRVSFQEDHAACEAARSAVRTHEPGADSWCAWTYQTITR